MFDGSLFLLCFSFLFSFQGVIKASANRQGLFILSNEFETITDILKLHVIWIISTLFQVKLFWKTYCFSIYNL